MICKVQVPIGDMEAAMAEGRRENRGAAAALLLSLKKKNPRLPALWWMPAGFLPILRLSAMG